MNKFYLLTFLASTTFAAPFGLTLLAGSLARRYVVLSPNLISRGLHVFTKDSVERVTERASDLSDSITKRWDLFKGVNDDERPFLTHYFQRVLYLDQHPQEGPQIWTPEVKNDLKSFLPEAQDFIAKLRKYPVERLLRSINYGLCSRRECIPAALLFELRGFESLLENNFYTKDTSSVKLEILLNKFKGLRPSGFRNTDEFAKKIVPTCNRIVCSFNEVLRRGHLSVQSAVGVVNSVSSVADAYNLIPRELTQEEKVISRQREELMELKRKARKVIAGMENKLAILIGEPSTSTYFFLQHPNLDNIGTDASLQGDAKAIFDLKLKIADLEINDSWACEVQKLILEECDRAFLAACVGAAVVPDWQHALKNLALALKDMRFPQIDVRFSKLD